MPPRICTIGVAQISPRLGDLEHNLSLYEESVRQAREQNIDLLVFPELSLTGYVLRDLVSSVALQPGMRELDRLAALSQDVALVVGLVEEANGGLFYNAGMYFDGGRLQHVHRKVYLPTYGMFDEQRYFARGNSIRAFDTRFGRVAILICEDLWHPSTASIAALDGATIVLCPSASPLRGVSEGTDVDDNARYWELVNQFYATTLGVFIVYANRVGFEDGVGFWGGSEITDPFGERLAKARYYETDLIAAEVSQDTTRRKRVAAPMIRDEDLDLTINELLRLRGRPQAIVPAPSEAGPQATRRRAPRPTSTPAARGKRTPARGGATRTKGGAAKKAARVVTGAKRARAAKSAKPARTSKSKSTRSRRRVAPVRKRTKRR